MYCPPTPSHSRDPLRQPLFDGWRTLVGLLSVWLAPLVFLVSLPLSADAVLISTGDGTGNTTPPSGDPGFANVGVVTNGLSGVYVRNGWVLTAGHVGEQAITLDGVLYQPIPGSGVHFQNPDGSPADLLAFKLAEQPPLADLLITNNPASLNSLITVIGNGRNRGAATTWMGQDGWTWGSGASIRWGTNRIHDIDTFTLGTHSFWISFDDLRGPIGGQHEADFVTGDSGGAAFTGSGASAELIGILVARATFEGQPASTSLYGNAGVIADLFYYAATSSRSSINRIATIHSTTMATDSATIPPIRAARVRRTPVSATQAWSATMVSTTIAMDSSTRRIPAARIPATRASAARSTNATTDSMTTRTSSSTSRMTTAASTRPIS